jgi:MFS family permease
MPVLDVLRTETPRPRIVRESRHAGRLAIATVCLGAFTAQLDAGIVAFSLPALQREFGAPPAAAQWVSLSYLLTVATVLIMIGRSVDTLGRKSVFLYGFMIVTIASAACGAAPTLGALITFRLVQAVGAAMLQAGGVSLMLRSALHGNPRAAVRAQGVAQALGLAAGPAIGGLIIATAGWRWVFLVNVPIGCAGVLAARYLLPRTREHAATGSPNRVRPVFVPAFLFTLLLIVSALSGLTMPPAGWAALAAIGALSGVCLWFWHRRRATDSPPVWRRMNIAVAGAVGGHLALSAPLVLFPQIWAARAVNPAIAGAAVAALPAGFALNSLAGKLTSRTRGAAGAALYVAAAGGLALASDMTAVSAILLMAAGTSLGVLVAAHTAIVRESMRHGGPPTGNRPWLGSREVGMALGVATATLCLHITGRPAFDPAGVRLTLAVLIVTASAAAGALPLARSRRPPAQAGTDRTAPDVRFLLANERTFLAWSRTALALVAAGLAIVQLLRPFPGVPWGRHLLGVPLILLGAAVATIGYLELKHNQRALYRDEPLPPSILPKVLALAITAIAIASAVVLIISAARGQ